MRLLDMISSPEDLKRFSMNELRVLSEEIRDTIIETVSKNGGHLASNLGVVELTIALHYVFNSPGDRIIWDVGHQSYPHKLLTGRNKVFHTLRKMGGIAGFPRPDESPHDAFGTGHSSTSISAGLGIACARDIKREDFKVIVVIGDGAMTAGMSFEALNHAGHLKKDIIVILNDNEMSISRNVGALSQYLNRILTGDLYRRFKKETKQILESMPKRIGEPFVKIAEKAEETLKGILLPPGLIFEELGFEYIGHIDGHDLELLVQTLRKIRDMKGPVLLHAITKKGKGYKYSEDDPCVFHGIGPFERQTGTFVTKSHKTYSEIFGEHLASMAREDQRIIAITAAMKDGTGLNLFYERFPERLFDVGIAEQHAVTFAAGLAREGMRPYVAIYSTFLQRAYDQIIHDVCIQRLPVVFCIDRAGIVGEDGPTHQGQFDLSYLRLVPELIIMAPKDGNEFKKMLEFSLQQDSPLAIRYPRGRAVFFDVPSEGIETGRAEMVLDGEDIAIIAIGNTVYPSFLAALKLKEILNIHPVVVNARFLKPFDIELINSITGRIKRIITVEDNAIIGGLGSMVLETLNGLHRTDVIVKCLGLPDHFIEHGSQSELLKKYGIDEDGILKAAYELLGEKIHV